jgi:hypothetical protein
MKNLSFKKTSYDLLVLEDMFFTSTDEVKKTTEFGSNILYTDDKKLTVSENRVMFENNSKDAAYSDSDKTAKALSYEISKNFCLMDKTRDDYKDGERNIVFTQMFNGYHIFNNFLSITFYEEGGYSVEFMYAEPVDFTNEKNEIYSPEEAVFNFASEVKKLYDFDEYTITEIDSGYFFLTSENIHKSVYNATPYYRIFVEGIKEPFYINALTNTFYHGV